MQRSLPEYERHNIAVFAISYDPVEALGQFAEKYGITYSLLSDVGSRVIRELGLLNEQVQQHHAFYGIPHRDNVYGVPYPGAFLLDERGVVTEKRFLDSYRMRETGAAILEAGFGMESAVRGPETRARADGLEVRAYLDSDTYRSMQRLRLAVELAIDAGLHVYGQPVPEGYIPLTIDVAPIDALEVGAMEGPAPRPFRAEGLDEAFFVYEGLVKFAVPLTFTERAGDRTIEVTVGYQACSATDCLLPSAVQLRMPVKVQSHIERDV
ncbi:MAG: redoxin domain-containing protein [Actinobacteria bacterium]|nr:redoxin domain-containing protein [Actinomycetota bacterium]